jgi:hypothetical protein
MPMKWRDRVSDWRNVRHPADEQRNREIAQAIKEGATDDSNSDGSTEDGYSRRYMSGMWAKDSAIHRTALEWLNAHHREFWASHE